MSVVEKELSEVGLRVIRLHSEGLCEALGEHLLDASLLKIGDLGHVATE